MDNGINIKKKKHKLSDKKFLEEIKIVRDFLE